MTQRFIARSTALAYRKLGAETIIMSARDSTLFSLNEVGSLIWQGADGRTPVSEITARICNEFEVTPEEASRDAQQFIADLSAQGLLLVSDQVIPGVRPSTEETP